MPRRSGSAGGRRTSGETTPARQASEGCNGEGAEPSQRVSRSKPQDGAALSPGLYIVATPIGHAEDITLRALKVLRAASVIACEDTRVTAKLMAIYEMATPRIAYHEHNAEEMRPRLIARMKAGDSVALVSDAGTPLISDPGWKLVHAVVDEGIPVTAIPGPSASLAALVLSGLPSDRFLFAGFLPVKEVGRRRAIGELAMVPATLIFFETGPRLAASLGDMAAVLGDRSAAVTRELTKMFEEVRRGTLADLAAHYERAGPPRGEIVVVVGPPVEEAHKIGEAAIDAQLQAALLSMSLKDASAAVAMATGLSRRAVYARALDLMGRET